MIKCGKMFSWDFNIWRYIVEETKQSEHLFVPYGLLGVFGFCAFYFFNSHVLAPNVYENIPLRVIAGILSLFLVFKNHYPSNLKKIMPIFWHFTLFFNLPFFFTFMILNNPHSSVWPLHGVHALTVLILMVDWLLFIALSIMGIFVGILFYVMTASSIQLPDNFLAILAVYTSIIVFCALFSQKNSVAHKERLNTMRTLAGAMAHELRTPLGTIALSAQILKMHLPALIKGYKQAKETNPALEEADVDYALKAPEEITLTTRNAFNVIDILLMNVKGVASDMRQETCNIKACILNALDAYPLTEDEKAVITCNLEDDFTFQGNELFMRHVIFNLLKNALYYVKAANKGGIFITAEKTPTENLLVFKDTGLGMPATMVPYVFDRFYSKTQHGTGIGLAFCKSVMESLDGKITCTAQEGEHTTFTLSFPKTNQR